MITIGRIVIYRSRTDNYSVPAIVAGSWNSLAWDNVEAGNIPPLSNEDCAHLVVFSSGYPGKRADAMDFEVESPHGRAENAGGSYQEWDIAYDAQGGPGTWCWYNDPGAEGRI